MCSAGPTVLGMSVHTLVTLFTVRFDVPPSLQVDQATACSMIAWSVDEGDDDGRKKGTSSSSSSSVTAIQVDEATGIVFVGTSDRKLAKISLSMEAKPRTRPMGEGTPSENL